MGSDVQYAKRVVVTGAGSGIGKGVALLLLERGSQVIAVDVNGGIARRRDRCRWPEHHLRCHEPRRSRAAPGARR
jgi:NAD(P)-dependent dehydrogenase (short-subunit alcohol dehydrogenase family)